MINLNTYIIEKLKINKNTELYINGDLTLDFAKSLKFWVNSVRDGIFRFKRDKDKEFENFRKFMSSKPAKVNNPMRKYVIELLNNYTENLPEIIGSDNDEETDREIFSMITDKEEIEWSKELD